MTHRTPTGHAPEDTWIKSSHSDENGNACIEIAHRPHAGEVAIRDSKDTAGPVLRVPAGQFAAFIDHVRGGQRRG